MLYHPRGCTRLFYKHLSLDIPIECNRRIFQVADPDCLLTHNYFTAISKYGVYSDPVNTPRILMSL